MPLSNIKVLCNLISLSNIIFKLLRTSNLFAVVIQFDTFLSSVEFSSFIILSKSKFEFNFALFFFSSSILYNLYIFNILFIILFLNILSIQLCS